MRRMKGLLVILDGKRNDIGSTATGYAEAYLGPGDYEPLGLRCTDRQPLSRRRQPDAICRNRESVRRGHLRLGEDKQPRRQAVSGHRC